MRDVKGEVGTKKYDKRRSFCKGSVVLLPIPRFQRMLRNKEISKELTWHDDKRVRDGYLRHLADAPSWKLVDRKWPDFGNEARNLRLAISADGINPRGLMSYAYSCWPVLMITYNLPL